MRVFNLLLVLLYLSLLATTEIANAHDQRLSPLADSQFQALHAEHYSASHQASSAEQEPDESDGLAIAEQFTDFLNAQPLTNIYTSPWLSFSSSPDTARAPPAI